MPAMDYSKVADLYDAFVTTQLDVPFFLEEAKRATRVLELMAGTGRLSIPLLEAGVKLTCVDSSPEMLAILREKLGRANLAADVHEMDVCELNLPAQFDLVVIPFHSFAEIVDVDAQRKALDRIRRHLTASGRFICTLHNPPARLRSVNGQMVQVASQPLPGGAGKLVVFLAERHDPAGSIVRGTQFFEQYSARGIQESKRCVDIQFFVHHRDQFQELAESGGFRVLELYGDYSRAAFDERTSPFMICILGRDND